MSSQRVSRGFPWCGVAVFLALIFFTSASVASEEITLVCSGKQRLGTRSGDSGTNVAGVSVIIDLTKRFAQTPVGVLPIVLLNENVIGFQTDDASGSIDRLIGESGFL